MDRLIITCDDAGMSKGINRSILKLASENLATTASVITNFDYLDDFAEGARTSSIACGVHFNLTEGYPLANLESDSLLVDDDGRFSRSMYSLMSLALLPHEKFHSAVELELARQVEKFLETGLTLGHVTTHMHFHMVPTLRRVVTEIAEAYHVPWIRTYQVTRSIVPSNILQNRHLPSIFRKSEPATLDYVLEISLWMNRYRAKRLAKTLMKLSGNVEIVVHPSEPIDDTYPEFLPNKPAQRHQQELYLRDLMKILNRTPHHFKIVDPAHLV